MTPDQAANSPTESPANSHDATAAPPAAAPNQPAVELSPDLHNAPTGLPDPSGTTSGTPDDKSGAGSESKPAEPSSAKRAIGVDFETTLERVRLDQIDGLDEDLQEFLREHDVLTEVSISLDRWTPQLLRLGVQRLQLMLWRRRGRLVHIGSGRMLTLARRMARHDDYLAANIIQAKTLSLKQKLTVLSTELLFESALHRAAPGHAEATFRLWQALSQAGVEPIKGKESRHFALAMGLSPATVRQRSKPKRTPD